VEHGFSGRGKLAIHITLPILDALFVDSKFHNIGHLVNNSLSILQPHFHPVCCSLRRKVSDVVDGIGHVETKPIRLVLAVVSNPLPCEYQFFHLPRA
jgi:hypothetical protein